MHLGLQRQLNGAHWEREVFDCSSQDFPRAGYMRWLPAVHDAMRRQPAFPWNPREPHTQIGLRLYESVSKHLSSGDTSLEFHCAIGTALDAWHHTDGFFRLGNRIVSIDLASGKYGKGDTRSVLFLKADRGITLIDTVGERIADLMERVNVAGAEFVWCNRAAERFG